MSNAKPDIPSPSFVDGNRKVLVVEDAPHVAKAIRIVLSQSGMEVMGPAATLMEARNLLATERPEVALLDVNVNGETAWTLIEELRAQLVPVVVMSGLPQHRYSGLSQLTFLQKPFNTEELFAALVAATNK